MSLFLNQQSNAATNKAPLISTKYQKTRNRGIRRILPKPRKPGNRPISGKYTNRGYPGFWGPGPQNSPPPAGDPRIALPDPGIALFEGGTPQNWPGGRGNTLFFAVFCCIRPNSGNFPLEAPKNVVVCTPGVRGNSGFPVPRNRPNREIGPNRAKPAPDPQFLGSRASKPLILVPGRGGSISPFLAVTRGGW